MERLPYSMIVRVATTTYLSLIIIDRDQLLYKYIYNKSSSNCKIFNETPECIIFASY